jgi:hypothetical protein
VLPNDRRKIAVKLKNEAWTIPRAREATLAAGQDFSTVRSTVGQDFDAKLCNSAERTAKAKLRTTQHQQRYAKQ